MQPPLQLHHTLENKLKLMTAEFWQSNFFNFDEFSHALIREAAREYNVGYSNLKTGLLKVGIVRCISTFTNDTMQLVLLCVRVKGVTFSCVD